MAKTKNGIVYPDNYDKVADVPADLKELAESVDEVIENNKTEMKKSNETRDEKISKNVEDIGIIQETIKSDKESIDKSLENINKKDNEQDEDIKANKESIEELQAENLEIKVENERLRNDIKSIAVVNEVSGENIHIEDSSDARCEIEIGGNHQQETREGYNLLNNDDLNLSSKTLQTKRKLKIDANTEYSIVSEKEFTDVAVNAFSDDINYEKLILTKEKQNKQYYYKFTTKSDTQTIYFYVVSADEYTNVNDFVNSTKLMLIKGSKAIDYEQYGASPSFAYPSSVKAVGNIKNILDMSNAKNGASAGIICTTNADGSYKYNGTATSQDINVWFMGGYATDLPTLFTLEPGTYYINDVSLFEGTTGFANDSSKKIWTFIRAYNVTGVRAVGAVSGNTYDETKYPIIAKIDHKIHWIPYNYGYAKIDIFNKNYLSKIPKKSITAQGITSTFDGEKFICKGTAQTNYFNLLTENVYKKIGKGIKTFSTNKLKKGRAFIHFDYVDGTGQNYYTSINTNQVSFTLNKDVESYRLNVDSITAGDTIDDNIYVQLEDGKIVTEIEKAENQEYLVDVQQEMLEGDTFVRQENKWYEKHGFGVSDTFNNENINISSTNIIETNGKNFYRHHLVFANDIKRKKGSYIKILSTHFKYNDSRWNTLEGICGWEAGNSFCIGTYDENYNTAEKMQTFLMNNHVKIYYELAESILLECTEAQSKVLDEIYSKAHTYKNITNILAESAEVNPTLNIKYLKDAETEHNKLQAQIDEIKQLLSTTETSAMLLNNMQTDLESEV
jgi:hypothetical protein